MSAALPTFLCWCSQTPSSWDPLIVSWLSIVSLGLFSFSFIYFGILLVERSFLMFILDYLVFYAMYMILWVLQGIIKWERPVANSMKCSLTPECEHSWFTQELNLYSFPDPMMITFIVFATLYVFIEVYTYKRRIPIFFTMVVSTFLITFAVLEVGLQRQLLGQFALNLILSILLTIVMCVMTVLFHDAFPFERRYVELVMEHDRRLRKEYKKTSPWSLLHRVNKKIKHYEDSSASHSVGSGGKRRHPL